DVLGDLGPDGVPARRRAAGLRARRSRRRAGRGRARGLVPGRHRFRHGPLPAAGRSSSGRAGPEPYGAAMSAGEEHIVFLDRETISPETRLRRPGFPHRWTEFERPSPDEVVERCADATLL